jgi:hypothetical protein
MMMNMEQSVEWEFAGETEVIGENLRSATLSTTNPTWPDLISKTGTNRLSYDTAKSILYLSSWYIINIPHNDDIRHIIC